MTQELKIAQGFNNTAGLAFISPAGAWAPISYVAYNPSLSRKINIQGPYISIIWDKLYETKVFSIFSQFGLSFKNKIYSANLTIQIPNQEDVTTNNYNGIANYYGPPKRDLKFWQGFEILVTDLVQI